MFERFTKDARRVVIAAEVEARALGAEAVGPEHLLLGFVVAVCGGRWLAPPYPAFGTFTLGTVGEAPRAITAAEVRAVLAQEEADALGRLGISLEAVREQVERDLGVDAWSRGSGARHLPFTGEAKRALELALREALDSRHRRLTGRHVLLGLLQHGGVNPILAQLGLAGEEVQAAVRASLLNESALARR